MLNFYDIDLIPIILERFKVSNIVTCDLLDENVLLKIKEYSKDNNASIISIYSNSEIPADFNDCGLNVLPNLKGFDAIFLNDDPNWYTTYNELNIIKQNNNEFPLVFICNNVFPHKYRDSYSNPNNIPDEFKNGFSKNLFLNSEIVIHDDYYHATEENTPKNGVFTAINDFLKENSSIDVLDVKFLKGITILYPKNSISQIRISKLSEEIQNYLINDEDLSDSIIMNQILSDYISKFNISEDDFDVIEKFKSELFEKDKIINDFEDKLKFHDEELSYKNTQITGVASELSLKDAQIKNYESKLVNSENKINDLNIQLKNIKDELNSLNSDLNQKNQDFKNKEQELNNQLLKANEFNSDMESKNIQIRRKDDELNREKQKLNVIKHQYSVQLAKLDNKEYCISCFKEEIENNHLEIQYLKNDSLTKKILTPFAYLYLLFKSNPKELSLNLKLYKALRSSKCFDIGYYLNNNEDIRESNWCKYFSPELHYVCNGFKEQRKFNKKYFNRNSKKELLDYIINCP